MQRLLWPACLAAFALGSVLAASGPMVPDYEVHLRLDPTVVLGSDNKLTPTVLSTFAMPTSVTKINVQYLDTVSLDLHSSGWSCRVRNIENDDGIDLTFKWRMPVTNRDIDGALSTAFNDSWNSGQGNYDAQIEWLSDSQTLSISRNYKGSEKGLSGTDDPSEKDSRAMLIDNAPDMFNDWASNNWGTGLLKSAVVYGPILTKRSSGTWSGVDLDIEVWPIQNGTAVDWLVEASFKTPNVGFAQTGRDQLMNLLKANGWFLSMSQSKEDVVLKSYHPTS